VRARRRNRGPAQWRVQSAVGFPDRAAAVLAREQLLELSRLRNAEVYDRSVDVLVGRLRKKIELDPKSPQLSVTEHGAGYILEAEVEAARD
jgi:DNA-binding response OmpR family regulator